MTTTLTGQVNDLRADEAQDIAVEAYVFLFPLVNMDVARRQMTNIEAGQRDGFGPINAFHHIRAFTPADEKIIARPNFDTLYSNAWLDLTREPVIVSAPDTEGRLYLLPMMDMWTDAFAVPGKRATGTRAARFAVVPPGWQGQLPAGVRRIDAPTRYVWIFGRTGTNGPADYEAVHRVQDGYAITPLSQWGRQPRPEPATMDPELDMTTGTLEQVQRMPAAEFFGYAAELLKLHPPHPTDWSMLARMRRIGIRPDESFDLDAVDPVIRQAVDAAPAAGQQLMQETLPRVGRLVHGWQMVTDTVGVYGNYYLKRAAFTILGMGALPVEESIYPFTSVDADGQPLDGASDYVLHFDSAELPPVNDFWSVTLYDADGFQVANPLNRFALGDRDPLHYSPDGSLDLVIQHEHPGAHREANWLPAPREPFGLVLRLYGPKAPAMNGRWAPPAVRRAT